MRSAGEARGYLPVKEEPAASKVPIKAAKPAHEPNMSGIDLTVGEGKERKEVVRRTQSGWICFQFDDKSSSTICV